MRDFAVELFNKRLKAIRKEKMYYNKFIFNGHFMVFLLILLGAFIFGYGEWLQHIPDNVNFALIAAIILSVISIFPIRPLLKEADKLFLLPFEKHMTKYMKISLIYSYFSRILLSIITLVVMFPLFYNINHKAVIFYVFVIISALLFPYLGLRLRWQSYQSRFSLVATNIILMVTFIISYYLLLGPKLYIAIVLLLIPVFIEWLLKKVKPQYLYPWERMIAVEQRHHMNYYKFVNMFTDVKHLKESAVRRKYLDVLLNVPKGKKFNSNAMYLFLFKRSFIRGRDAFNIIFRLIIIAVLLMIWLPYTIVTIIIGALFMYLILLQMAQFYSQQAYGLWPQVWPVADSKVIKGYEQFLYRLMIVIGIILSVTFIMTHWILAYAAIVFFIVGWLTIRSIIKKLKYQETLLRD
ncbi:ABC transporter permease [Staphylococcus simiae]|uniref:ABC transporter permease EcsB n=1 Tax=Staphylococcus simiae TaxID=308354 RepID=UPI001A95DB01|nr:ABC transporter permease [Staphylococcus simiae]MBO1199199.1 ABC transporter permease [Staphylococcus simiae]MBO1201398.1 ABC transporter permease [Staphylococcus simiae]MBO1203548.1 ABC transporter permease [Staphylococcus simiae]MBO1211171.1 ABC transporter permease [Staphylococcus simiae]MBO1229738.1 ABC transporter permease [Staphylococcus simiae]